MADLQRKDYEAAARTFNDLLEQFPVEGFLADRSRVYLELATRELRRRPVTGGSIEERLTAATAALNNQSNEDARRLAEGVLAEDAQQDLAVYLLAVLAVRAGDFQAALERLRTAIDLNPENRLQARQDEELDPLFDLEEFHQLTEAPPAPPAAAPLNAKRPMRRSR